MEGIVTISKIPQTRHFNFIDASSLNSVHGNTRFRNIGIRYVGAGSETYTLRDMPFDIGQNCYLVGNQYAEGRIDIESKIPVRGICIDLDPVLVAQVVASHLRPDTAHPDQALDTFFQGEDFPEHLQVAKETFLGKQLLELDALSREKPLKNAQFREDFFYQIACGLVQDSTLIQQQMQSLKTLRRPVRKDLFRRVTLGKLYLDEHFSEAITVAEVARAAAMSEFHFFRLFKAVYGVSPHQYAVKKRIILAQELIRRRKGTLSEIAFLCGFADVFAFSKAFKKHTCVPPSQF